MTKNPKGIETTKTPYELLTRNGYIPVPEEIGHKKQLFVLLDQPSREKLKKNLFLSVLPDICVFNRCELGERNPHGIKTIHILDDEHYSYKLYNFKNGKMRGIKLPAISQNSRNPFERVSTKSSYLTNAGGQDEYYRGPMGRAQR